MPDALNTPRILLVISGGIAAYKSLELIRLLKKQGGTVRCILTQGGEKFVTPFSVSALSGAPVYTDLWSLKDETDMGHIRLSREADLIVVAPASAHIIAQMAHGLAGDLATTTLLAADKPVLLAPAMNHRMWAHPATQANLALLQARGVAVLPPTAGDMACGETGMGRMAEPETIMQTIHDMLHPHQPLKGLRALVTAGPTFEPLDPVRFIGNRSSGKQGYAIARALHKAGAHVTLICGPVTLPDPVGVHTCHVETAQQMLEASLSALPADIAVCTAAVSDWSAQDPQDHKIKKRSAHTPPVLALKENPDILKTLSHHEHRPRLVIGFSAETQDLHTHTREKLARKGCDWLLANQVGTGQPSGQEVFGQDTTHIIRFTAGTTEDWGPQTKQAVAERLVQTITAHWDRGEA